MTVRALLPARSGWFRQLGSLALGEATKAMGSALPSAFPLSRSMKSLFMLSPQSSLLNAQMFPQGSPSSSFVASKPGSGLLHQPATRVVYQ